MHLARRLAVPLVRRAALLASLAASLLTSPLVAQVGTPVAPADSAPRLASATLVVQVGDTAVTPIPGAEIVIPTLGILQRVNESGQLRIVDVRPGRHVVSARRFGFRPETQFIVLEPGSTRTMAFYLEPSATRLGTVVVRGERGAEMRGRLAEFEQRRQRGFGSFVTREEIDKRNPLMTRELLLRFPALTVVPIGMGRTEVRLRRADLMGAFTSCAPVYFVDGMRVDGVTVDDFPPSTVEGIELYTSGGLIPPQFRVANAGCGVIAIWTRIGGDR